MRELIELRKYLIATVEEKKSSQHPVDMLLTLNTLRILLQLEKAIQDLKKEQLTLHLN